jgi:hypothetical protein
MLKVILYLSFFPSTIENAVTVKYRSTTVFYYYVGRHNIFATTYCITDTVAPF